MGKFGRKVCCDYNINTQCVFLVDGNKLCVFDETSEEQFENGDLQFGVCPLLPESEKESLLASMEKEGFFNIRTFRD